MSGQQDRKTLHVAAAIIVREGQALAARRSDDIFSWEFPGGKVEPGETSEAACRREILEELGCELKTMWQVDTLEYDYPDFHLSMDCFVATIDPDAEPKPLVHKELRWIGQEGLATLPWLAADRKLAQELGPSWDLIAGGEQI
ncbi:MAG: (deoxy)nucleoside triphosphate pyrophosphohydrolase [Tractidigestivibacter sp.]|jgi:8-oxo-dGTP diphosphatase|uniref:(deoxy)nucleoside triphosphate pyrophosphohydrolase n=1 Tax=Tractidigestivibacter sp. TaxID=2847320 RepID=UPI003D921674